MQTQSNLKTFFFVMALIRTSVCCMTKKDTSHQCATNNTKNTKKNSIPSLRNTSFPDTTNYTGYTAARMKQEISNYGKLILTL